MPAYNAEATLQASVNSVQLQVYTEWELLLIVDIKSQDRTLEMAHTMAKQEPRIRLITGLPRGGCVFNRNYGLREACGDFICLLDSDDLWHPQKLEKQIIHVTETRADLACTGYGWMSSDGQPLSTIVLPPERITHGALLLENHIGCLTVMLRRARFPKLEFIEFLHEDYILWLRLLRETEAYGLRENLATYRLARHSRSGNKLHSAAKRWAILRRFEKLPLTRALWCFSHYAFGALKKRTP
jgi:teichuronic acid biosynthesis glycosyltransferase TuaG